MHDTHCNIVHVRVPGPSLYETQLPNVAPMHQSLMGLVCAVIVLYRAPVAGPVPVPVHPLRLYSMFVYDPCQPAPSSGALGEVGGDWTS